MPGLPNYRRLLGPKNIVEDREIADEYGRTPPTFTVISGDGAFGSITEATTEDLTIGFTPAVGSSGIDAVNQGLITFVSYEGDDGAFSLPTLATLDVDPSDAPLVEGKFIFAPILVSGIAGSGTTFQIEALAADDGVEKSGTLHFYRRILSGDPPTFGDLVLTIELSKTYNPG